MNTIEHYEIKARAFQIMTGEMAPGKDVPSCGPSSEQESGYEHRVMVEECSDWSPTGEGCE